jgi:hypothetical protein
MGNREKQEYFGERQSFQWRLSDRTNEATGIVATTTNKVWKAKNRAFRIERVYLNCPAGFAADAANYWTIQILSDAAVVAASWSTLTGSQGALTADTPVEMVLSATDADCVVLDTKILSVKALKTASAAALPTVDLVIEGTYY